MDLRLGQPVAALNRPSLDLDFARYASPPPILSFNRASKAWDFALAEHTADAPRLSSKGLLIEGQRTNHVPDSTFSTADPATNTLPSGVLVSVPGSGAAVTITGTATDAAGRHYMDLRINHTWPDGAGWGVIFFMPGVPTNPSQDVAGTLGLALADGSLTGTTDHRVGIDQRDASNSFMGLNSLDTFPGLDDLAAPNGQRYDGAGSTAATSDASLETTGLWINPNYVIGGTLDFTYRFDSPQYEFGAFPSSPILTSGTALTRAADVASVGLGSWFDANQGTLLVEAEINGVAESRLASLCDGGSDNEVALALDASGNVRARTRRNGSDETSVGSGTASAGDSVRVALSYNGSDLRFCRDGGAVATSSATFPTMGNLTKLGIGSAVSDAFMFGHIRRIVYWPRVLGDNQLQAVTT